MRNLKRWVLFGSVAVVLCVSALVNLSSPVSSQGNRKGVKLPTGLPPLENFDIRAASRNAEPESESPTVKGKASSNTLMSLERPKQAFSSPSIRALQKSMRSAQERLSKSVPNLRVVYNDTARVPEIIGVEGGGALAAGSNTKEAHEDTLRNFMAEHSDVFGLTNSQVTQLTKVSDYTNPAGNLSFVEFAQEINGVPVFQGYVRGIFSADGRLMRTTGLLAPGIASAPRDIAPELDAAGAVAAAARSINVNTSAFSVEDNSANGLSKTVIARPFDDPTKTQLVYFPVALGSFRLAYSMVLWQPTYSYIVIVDANTGELLWRKCITDEQTQAATYKIYDNDSPTPSAPVPGTPATITSTVPQPPGISRTTLTLISEHSSNNLGWISDAAGDTPPTTGNNVDAGLDIVAPNGIDPTGRAIATTGRVFDFPYSPDGSTDGSGSVSTSDASFRMGVVTNLFFWTNRYHDRLYELGFTEPARNFQTDNFARGGSGADHVLAEAQDISGTNNANFNTPPDGTSGRMQMFLWTGTPIRDGDVDQEVIFHELTHGTSNRLHANATGLGADTSRGMGEGWSDFYAISLLALHTPDGDDGKRLYAMGAYDTRNYYRAIRRFPYAVKSALAANGKSHNPLTFADIDPAQINVSDAAFPVAAGQANQVHNQGEVWCSSLIEVRAQLIENLGFAPGSQKTLQIVTDGMKLDPINPTMLDARDSILAANCAGYAGADELDIWEGFRIRGMGFRASTAGIHVTENFDGPNLRLGTVTATEVVGSSNGNGSIDPGETASISIPLTNILCATEATSATATLTPGGGVGNYGTVAPGATETETIEFIVPVETGCGTAVPITIDVNSSLGPISYTYNLNIGQAAPLTSFENFDGVTAPALPTGWTTQRTGAGSLWVTSTTNPDTAPNDVFTPNAANAGISELLSPSFPVNTGFGQLAFRNLYNLEDGFDNMQLHIKIGSAPFQEIIAAGGSFVSGGYNAETNTGLSWSGLSAGTTASPAYIDTVVNLPPAASGQIVQLKWTVTADANTTAPGAAGVRIDTVQISTSALPCTPLGVATVSISGQVTDGANGINGIQITLSGSTEATTTTGGNGNYSFPNLISGGSYAVAPTSPGFESTPPIRVYNNLATNVTDANFVLAVEPRISGRVTTPNGAQGIDGITIDLTGTSSSSTTTSGGGFYTFGPLTRGGDYTVTPSGSNNTFSPASRTYNNLQGTITDANFVALENIACTAIGSPTSGQIAAGDPTQANRVFRGGTPSDCGGRPFPGLNADPSPVVRRFDQYTYVNSSGSPICVKVTLKADNAGIHSVAYLGSYNPADISQNYLGDLGVAYAANTEASYSFTVPAGATYVIVVHEITPNTPATINYTFAQCITTTTTAVAPPLAQPGQVLITEFRQSVGATTSSNEYIELYNNTDGPISINGYAIAIFNNAFGGDVFLGLPAGTTIPRRGHLIIANVAAGGYSLSGYAAPDLSHANANLMPDNQGFGLIDGSRTVMIDSVGFAGNGGNLPYIEGTGLRPTTGARPNVEHAWVRKMSTANSFPIDTGDNLNDFVLVSETAATFNATPTPIASMLGAPGPENRSSPVDRSVHIRSGLVDPAASASGGENRVRFLACGVGNAPPCPADPLTSAAGYLSIRRRFTNNSGADVRRLRFRIIDITTLNSPGYAVGGGQADLRALTSGPITVSINGTPTTIEGTTVETPPAQVLGGGHNTSLSAGTITFATPLPHGQRINVQFMLGVQQGGTFRFVVNIEALP